MTNTIRVRFAPSPTGYLHVGGARTALFNWLFARHTGGKFLLRIEDTDKQRSSEENTRVILDGLAWLGLDWDEDPVFQGARLARHQELADRLLTEGQAYLDEGAIRLRLPPGEIAWDDAVHGRIAFKGEDIKDFVILRSDRTPLYNFAVVADDLDMAVTHVIRGDDHISNTPKQIAVYRALGKQPPVFGHVPMIHGPDGKKLSKRHGATAVGDYQHLGILPAAMRNFLALLGWSPGEDREMLSLEEMVRLFTLEGILEKAAVFDMTKLYWMNGQYIQRADPEKLLGLIESDLRQAGLDLTAIPRLRLLRAIDVQRERARTTLEIVERTAVRFDARRVQPDEKAERLIAGDPEGFRGMLSAVIERLGALGPAAWTPERLEAELRAIADTKGVAAGAVFQPVRVALTGTTVSEPVNLLLEVVGRDESLSRLKTARAWMPART
jgi:glutamyl-tRNA synthetase